MTFPQGMWKRKSLVEVTKLLIVNIFSHLKNAKKKQENKGKISK